MRASSVLGVAPTRAHHRKASLSEGRDSMPIARRQFVGNGTRDELPFGREIEPWRCRENDDGSREYEAVDHPAGYMAHPDLVDAVNTALALGKPLLLTGRPGT